MTMDTAELFAGFRRGGHSTLAEAADAARTPSPEIPGGHHLHGPADANAAPTMNTLLRAAYGIAAPPTPEDRAEREAQKARAREMYLAAGVPVPPELRAAVPDFGGGPRGQAVEQPGPNLNDALLALFRSHRNDR